MQPIIGLCSPKTGAYDLNEVESGLQEYDTLKLHS